MGRRWLAVFICKSLSLGVVVYVALLSLSCSSKPPQESRTPPAAQPQTQASSTGQASVPPFVPAEEDGQWTMPAKNYASTRFSGLEEINAGNVKNLKVAWTFSTGVNRGHEAAPLVVGKTMYVVTPFPNILYALDLEKAAKKENPLKWKYEPKPLAA